MSDAATNRRGDFARAITAALFTLGIASAQAADPWKNIDVRPHEMVGTLSCSAVSCHGGGGPRYWSGGIAGAEYVHWLGHAGTFSEGRKHYDPRARLETNDGDPHALAGQRISSSRFQEVLKRASLQADGSVDSAMYQRCAACHDPQAIERAEVLRTQYSAPDASGVQMTGPPVAAYAPAQRERGISCESCHGGAKQWIAVHYERGVSRERLLELGMVDTKNLFLRARLCAGCHVGSAENDMNHDMIAAGHPPLRFELASYEALIGTKHWDDRPERAAEPQYEVQLWAAGRIAAAEAALALLEGRAKRAASDHSAAPWPEFAEGNCFACHQPMRSIASGSSKRSSSGAIVWQSWNLALLTSAASSMAETESNLPPAALGPLLDRLRNAMEASVEPPPGEIARLAATARESLQATAKIDASGRILDRDGYPLQIRAAGQQSPSAVAMQNWDDLCQQVAALAATRRAIADATGGRHFEAEQRLLAIARLLRFQRADRQWPSLFANMTAAKSSATMLNDIGRELDAIRSELLQAALQIGSHP
jgi:hypothetical protein